MANKRGKGGGAERCSPAGAFSPKGLENGRGSVCFFEMHLSPCGGRDRLILPEPKCCDPYNEARIHLMGVSLPGVLFYEGVSLNPELF